MSDDEIHDDHNDGITKIILLFREKINSYEEIIKRTMLNVSYNKHFNIISSTELNQCTNEMNILLADLRILELYILNHDCDIDIDTVINDIQVINNKLSCVMKSYGTRCISDLIYVCFGQECLEMSMNEYTDKFLLINKYVHPVSYKLIQNINTSGNKKQVIQTTNKILEDIQICETSDHLGVYDVGRTLGQNTHISVFGIKVVIKNGDDVILVTAIIDDILIDYLGKYEYLSNKIHEFRDSKPPGSEYQDEKFDTYIQTLNLKDYLIYDIDTIHERFIGYINNVKLLKAKPLTRVVNDFLKDDFITKRLTLIQLLMHSEDNDFQYLSYLLYDTLSSDDKSNDDTHEQNKLFDSLPWVIKMKFKGAMKTTVQYTTNLLNFDVNNRLPLEQRICLMKTTDQVKEKAMVKLKEVKSKTDDSGSKARQYLDGLLKIPFGLYKNEPIFTTMNDINKKFRDLSTHHSIDIMHLLTPNRDNLTAIEINFILNSLMVDIGIDDASRLETMYYIVDKWKKKDIQDCFLALQTILHSKNNETEDEFINQCLINQNTTNKSGLKGKLCLLLSRMVVKMDLFQDIVIGTDIFNTETTLLYKDIVNIKNENKLVSNYIHDVKKTLDTSVYGHDDAKRQIERIIGQWINGKETGYCIGFEGPPGVGKTSLAKKGLACCLKDENNQPRPFAFIAIGGSSNGSTLEGHNYTYVGSTWGRIVDILIENKCMNPIIFIDEVDKVSRTENGREIISILTHLTDPTQNDTFQDKYFSGIEIDLSKVLFVFSYNDKDLIDRILMDRIHRVKFDHLTLEDKLVICKKHMLPEILENMGQVGNIIFSDEVLTYVIEEYTYESGVRKLKEILNEIIGEINLELLRCVDFVELPVVVTEDDVKVKYLKNHPQVRAKLIHKKDELGIMNGLWANALGKGGIIPIECKLFPSNTFLDLKLTGQQGDVMKESMNVAKTLAWQLTSENRQQELLKLFETTKVQGIHIHCPEGAVPKDGPSAGTAITIAIFSTLNNQRIKHDLAITGEMNLQGCVTAIGGLDLKIIGGIRAGVKTFLFPKENHDDFVKFQDKSKDKSILEGISFHEIETIEEAIQYSIVI